MTDRLDALLKRGDELERFADANRQALEYIKKTGSQQLVTELKECRDQQRRMKLGTINTLVLLHHIDRLEAEIAKEPLFLA